jgi:hypothetical protein
MNDTYTDTNDSIFDVILKTFPTAYSSSRDSVVDIATGWTTEGSEFEPRRVKNFLFSKSSRTALGPNQPPIQRGTEDFSPGLKRQGRDVDHSPPARAVVKKMWIYISTASYAFIA